MPDKKLESNAASLFVSWFNKRHNTNFCVEANNDGRNENKTPWIDVMLRSPHMSIALQVVVADGIQRVAAAECRKQPGRAILTNPDIINDIKEAIIKKQYNESTLIIYMEHVCLINETYLQKELCKYANKTICNGVYFVSNDQIVPLKNIIFI